MNTRDFNYVKNATEKQISPYVRVKGKIEYQKLTSTLSDDHEWLISEVIYSNHLSEYLTTDDYSGKLEVSFLNRYSVSSLGTNKGQETLRIDNWEDSGMVATLTLSKNGMVKRTAKFNIPTLDWTNEILTIMIDRLRTWAFKQYLTARIDDVFHGLVGADTAFRLEQYESFFKHLNHAKANILQRMAEDDERHHSGILLVKEAVNK